MLMMSNGAFVPTYKLCFFQNEGLGQTDNLGYIFTFCDFQSAGYRNPSAGYRNKKNVFSYMWKTSPLELAYYFVFLNAGICHAYCAV